MNDQTATATSTITEVTQERAYDIIAGLTDAKRFENAAMLIVSGVSELLGSIYVIIPPLGKSLLLPFANQSVSS